MSNPRRRIAAVFFVALAAAAAAPAADPFYEGLMRQGIRAYAEGDAARAAKLLRLACFGMLEEPDALGAGLVYLAIAQVEAGDEEAFRVTFERILEVERHFQGNTRAKLPESVRQRFEEHLESLVPHEVLAGSSTFRHVAQRQMTAQASADSVAEVPEGGEAASPEEGGGEAVPEAAPELPQEVVAALDQAREVMRAGLLNELLEQFHQIRRLAEAHPEASAVQHLAGELAYRVKLWPESRTYFERGGEIDPDRPDLHFYYAVVLYESGDVENAREALDQCLPRLRTNDFIREYAARIRRGGG